MSDALADVTACGVECALVGGLAVGVRATERTTRDVDLVVVCPDDGAAERLVVALQRRGYDVAQLLEHQPSGAIATVRLLSRARPRTHVDLLVRATGIEREIARAAERVEVAAGFVAPVARAGHLVAMKIVSRGKSRPRDAQDLVELLREISPDDLALARDACTRIDGIGLHPNRSMRDELEAEIAVQSPSLG